MRHRPWTQQCHGARLGSSPGLWLCSSYKAAYIWFLQIRIQRQGGYLEGDWGNATKNGVVRGGLEGTLSAHGGDRGQQGPIPRQPWEGVQDMSQSHATQGGRTLACAAVDSPSPMAEGWERKRSMASTLACLMCRCKAQSGRKLCVMSSRKMLQSQILLPYSIPRIILFFSLCFSFLLCKMRMLFPIRLECGFDKRMHVQHPQLAELTPKEVRFLSRHLFNFCLWEWPRAGFPRLSSLGHTPSQEISLNWKALHFN